jgi:hypothetical protein
VWSRLPGLRSRPALSLLLVLFLAFEAAAAHMDRAREVSFENDGLRLVGTLLVPAEPQRFLPCSSFPGQLLRSTPGIDADRLFILWHSEGGTPAPWSPNAPAPSPA